MTTTTPEEILKGPTIGKTIPSDMRAVNMITAVAEEQERKIRGLMALIASANQRIEEMAKRLDYLETATDFVPASSYKSSAIKDKTKRKRADTDLPAAVNLQQRSHQGDFKNKRRRLHQPLELLDIKSATAKQPSKELLMAAYLNALPKSEANALLEDAATRYKSHTEEVSKKRRDAVANRKTRKAATETKQPEQSRSDPVLPEMDTDIDCSSNDDGPVNIADLFA